MVDNNDSIVVTQSQQQQQEETQSRRQQRTIQFHIIGSMYVDLFCYLQENHIPISGGDSHLTQPVSIHAGGSTTNTAIHLQTLLQQHAKPTTTTTTTTTATNDTTSSSNITIHSSINENDNYGTLLLRTCQQSNITIANYRTSTKNQHHDGTNGTNENHNTTTNNTTNNNNNDGTPHCVVIVAGGERSFMSFQGCIDNFVPSMIDWDSIISRRDSKNNNNNEDPIHIHIAGYYCTTGFVNGTLLPALQQLRSNQQQQQQQQHNPQPIIISLVTQSDATQQWDGGIYDLLPCLDFVIMNYDEATNIYRRGIVKNNNEKFNNNNTNSESGTTSNTDEKLIHYFSLWNTNTCYIITKGRYGAIAFRNYRIIASLPLALPVQLIDPTGAGDAFVSGFLYGFYYYYNDSTTTDTITVDYNNNNNNNNGTVISSSSSSYWTYDDTRIRNGLLWGCATGTAIVQIQGASTPTTYDTISAIYNKQQQQQQKQQL